MFYDWQHFFIRKLLIIALLKFVCIFDLRKSYVWITFDRDQQPNPYISSLYSLNRGHRIWFTKAREVAQLCNWDIDK